MSVSHFQSCMALASWIFLLARCASRSGGTQCLFQVTLFVASWSFLLWSAPCTGSRCSDFDTGSAAPALSLRKTGTHPIPSSSCSASLSFCVHCSSSLQELGLCSPCSTCPQQISHLPWPLLAARRPCLVPEAFSGCLP